MSKNGFTLTEILITLVIIGVLAGLALPAYRATVENSRNQEAFLNLNIIHMGEKLYRINNSVYWPTPANSTLANVNTALGVDMTSLYFGPSVVITRTGGATYTATLRRNATGGGNGAADGSAGGTCWRRVYNNEVVLPDIVAC